MEMRGGGGREGRVVERETKRQIDEDKDRERETYRDLVRLTRAREGSRGSKIPRRHYRGAEGSWESSGRLGRRQGPCILDTLANIPYMQDLYCGTAWNVRQPQASWMSINRSCLGKSWFMCSLEYYTTINRGEVDVYVPATHHHS